jgi:hypothetical protein
MSSLRRLAKIAIHHPSVREENRHWDRAIRYFGEAERLAVKPYEQEEITTTDAIERLNNCVNAARVEVAAALDIRQWLVSPGEELDVEAELMSVFGPLRDRLLNEKQRREQETEAKRLADQRAKEQVDRRAEEAKQAKLRAEREADERRAEAARAQAEKERKKEAEEARKRKMSALGTGLASLPDRLFEDTAAREVLLVRAAVDAGLDKLKCVELALNKLGQRSAYASIAHLFEPPPPGTAPMRDFGFSTTRWFPSPPFPPLRSVHAARVTPVRRNAVLLRAVSRVEQDVVAGRPIRRISFCERCEGTSELEIAESCARCNGTGVRPGGLFFAIRMPAHRVPRGELCGFCNMGVAHRIEACDACDGTGLNET